MKPRTLLLAAALIAACLLVARADSLSVLQSWLHVAMQTLSRENLPLPYPAPPASEKWSSMNPAERLANVRARLLPKLHDELAAKHCKLGQPALIRIFKESRELELWLQGSTSEWTLFRTYPIACFSGTLGPKTREGDMQAPEGFYRVTAKQLNPASSYHLAFNIGYPNAYDLSQHRTGSLIMIHGDTCSVGCFAMTDPIIEEIYLIVQAALTHTPNVPVHSFPFRMTKERMKNPDPAHKFWEELVPAYEVFEKEKRVPQVEMDGGRYRAD
ncbi:MAG: L,D-transpeptidase family protein [Prosthecobacter sp.]|uniref:L,D-transpeptidase family protein n=1 Tax=Prosthecobacter sp. TaxID=1965333 RepID=UPI002612C03A|nr:L,D-transpeptidase family protein [Prosthecobacter sp.]MCF7790147.1 L,D-transpeptidase family protein [Prosthecobacter sp.]